MSRQEKEKSLLMVMSYLSALSGVVSHKMMEGKLTDSQIDDLMVQAESFQDAIDNTEQIVDAIVIPEYK